MFNVASQRVPADLVSVAPWLEATFPKAAFGRSRSYDRNTTDGKAIPRMKKFLFCLHPWDGFAIRGNYLRAARRSHTHRL
jgi:hypothetical protein